MNATTQERIDAIRAVYEPGMSAKQIAERLAMRERRFISRNSIIGMYQRHREQLADIPLLPQGTNLCRPAPRKRSDKPRAAYVKKAKPKPPPKLAEVVEFVPAPREVEYAAGHPTKRLYQLEARECRWPMGGSGFDIQFCSQHAEGSYCEHHRRLSVGPGTKFERGAAKALRRLA